MNFCCKKATCFHHNIFLGWAAHISPWGEIDQTLLDPCRGSLCNCIQTRLEIGSKREQLLKEQWRPLPFPLSQAVYCREVQVHHQLKQGTGCARHYVEQDSVQSQGEGCFLCAWGTALASWTLVAVSPLTSLGQKVALTFAFLKNQHMWVERRSPGYSLARAWSISGGDGVGKEGISCPPEQ